MVETMGHQDQAVQRIPMFERGQVLFLVSRQPRAKLAGEYPFKSVWPFVADRKMGGTSCNFSYLDLKMTIAIEC